ncbi:hypothetical protein EJ06DRAFT_349783 [Trichodelitschia bisporula]|uniref:Uncharacterized protein n=1 Tax=Trichodelitschia bisporula TaxID=703511 RepID=A0A6G1I0S9_9PEZI|nr:hypothetical protein EJ06DRAFT_349783 [Trichodelitschia bisporula]
MKIGILATAPRLSISTRSSARFASSPSKKGSPYHPAAAQRCRKKQGSEARRAGSFVFPMPLFFHTHTRDPKVHARGRASRRSRSYGPCLVSVRPRVGSASFGADTAQAAAGGHMCGFYGKSSPGHWCLQGAGGRRSAVALMRGVQGARRAHQ